MEIVKKVQAQFSLNPDLRVLFFFDPQREHESELFAEPIPGVHTILVAGQHFSLKIKLESELKDKRVLLYFPSKRPSEKEKASFVLLDILIANKELLLDDVADFMDSYKLMPHQRSIVSQYIQELKLKKHQKVLINILNPGDFKEEKVIRGLISAYLDFPKIVDPSLALAKLFVLTLPANQERLDAFLKKSASEVIQSEILRWLYQHTEYSSQSLDKETLFSAFRKLKYNALTQHQPSVHGADPYGLLKIDDPITLQRLNALLIDWKSDEKLAPHFEDVFAKTGDDIKESQLVQAYGFDEKFSVYTVALLNLVVEGMLKLVNLQPAKVQSVLLNLPQGDSPESSRSHLLRFCAVTANFFELLGSIQSYKLDTPKQYLDKYTEEYYKIDSDYRSMIGLLESINKSPYARLKNLDSVVDEIHTKYEKFLVELNREWLACLSAHKFDLNKIPVRKQSEFIPQFVKAQDQKVAVVISDALRYEAAQDLLKALLVDTKGHASMDYCLAGLPSVTSWGMANLLATKNLEFSGDALSIAGMSTEGTENREKILQQVDSTAVAFTVKTLQSLPSQQEIRDRYFNQRGIIYIYHDEIDSTGDSKKTELNTFAAVSRTITDLAELVKKIHATYNISRVLITSDHGFLYNQRPLSDSTFQKLPEGKHLKSASRYILTDDIRQAGNDYVVELSNVQAVKSKLKLIIPRGVNRYKKQGAGSHFVHGGSSLQELVVPVIESTRKRKDVAQKVPFKVMNQTFTMVSGALKVRVFQELPIGSTMKMRTIVVGIYNSPNQLCSNEVIHELNSGSDAPSERTKEFILNLNSGGSQDSVLTLKIFDAEDADRLNPLGAYKVINNTLIESDF